jgi:hypothetical protein
MDPRDKYRTPKPSTRHLPADVSHLPASKVSLASLSACFSRLARRRIRDTDEDQGPTKSRCKSSKSLPRQSRIMASFHGRRAIKSAEEGLNPRSKESSVPLVQQPCYLASRSQDCVTAPNAATCENPDTNSNHLPATTEVGPGAVALPPTGLSMLPNTHNASVGGNKQTTRSENQSIYATPDSANKTISQDRDYVQVVDAPAYAFECAPEVPAQRYSSARSSSYFTNDLCSLSFGPSTTRTGSMSPRLFSHSDSPVASQFEQHTSWTNDQATVHPSPSLNSIPKKLNVVESELYPLGVDSTVPAQHQSAVDITPNSPRAGFQGHSLPDTKYGSTTTLKPLLATTSEPLDFRSPFSEMVSRSRVQTWNDGSEDHMNALLELVVDHGYLGDIIN